MGLKKLDLWVKISLINKTFVYEPVQLLGLHDVLFGCDKRIFKHLVHEGV